MKKDIKILAIETSCDETSAAVICGTNYSTRYNNQDTITKQISKSNNQYPIILSNVVSSQIDLHAKTGGVVPEVASRAHMEAIIPVIEEALVVGRGESGVGGISLKLPTPDALLLTDITHIAVTAGPGLIGSLLVGFNTAKSLAYALDIPIVLVNHIEGHIYSAMSGARYNNQDTITKQFPILALTVSGGHTSLTLMRDHGKYETIGQTRDDAAGEAFDKVAKLLDLGYPGGPAVSKLADKYREGGELGVGSVERRIKNPLHPTPCTLPLILPRPMINDKSFDFSFSGLKTAVLDVVRQLESPTKLRIKQNYEITNGTNQRVNQLTIDQKSEICAAFEDAAVDVLVTKTLRAAQKYQPKAVILAGGVAANKRLREQLTKELKNLKTEEQVELNLLVPPINLCGDNAAMIGLAAYYHILRGDVSSWDKISIDSNLAL